MREGVCERVPSKHYRINPPIACPLCAHKRTGRTAQDKKKDKEEISSLCYWQGEAKLITASWDGLVRIFDDGEAAEEG